MDSNIVQSIQNIMKICDIREGTIKHQIFMQHINKLMIASIANGITRYAWWKDGVQYVGTGGKTLKQALTKEAAHKPCGD